MAARVAILLYLAAARGVWFVFEQPHGSLFEHHPRMQELFGILNIHRKFIRMLDFGGPTEKPTWLYSRLSASEFVQALLLLNPCCSLAA